MMSTQDTTAPTVDPKDDPKQLLDLASMYHDRYKRYKRAHLLDDAIYWTRLSLGLTDKTSDDFNSSSIFLVLLLEKRLLVKDSDEDIEGIINISREAISKASSQGQIIRCWRSLSSGLFSRYPKSKSPSDLLELYQLVTKIMDANVLEGADLALYSYRLAKILEWRLEQQYDPKEQEELLRLARQSVELTPGVTPRRRYLLDYVASQLHHHFMISGKLASLKDAIHFARSLISTSSALLSETDNGKTINNHALYVNNLAVMLRNLYGNTRAFQDLEESNDYARQALNLTQVDDVLWARRVGNLASGLSDRYERSGDSVDKETAIGLFRAIETAIHRPRDYLELIARGRYMRLRLTGRIECLDQVIESLELAIAEEDASDPDRSELSVMLGNMLSIRFERDKQIEDINTAIANGESVLSSRPSKRRSASLMYDLGYKYLLRSWHLDSNADLESASRWFMTVWNDTDFDPIARLKSGSLCLELFADQQRTQEGLNLGRQIVELLPRMLSYAQSRGDKQFILEKLADMPSHLCSLLLSAGLVAEAVEQLERCRSIIFAGNLDQRIEGALVDQPELSKRYHDLVDSVKKTILVPSQSPDLLVELYGQRVRAVAVLKDCLAEIRETEGYQNFHQTQKISVLQQYLRRGFVVIVNIHKTRCDAIIVSRTTLEHIPLDEMSFEDVEKWLKVKWITRSQKGQYNKNKQFLGYLAWLWQVCVEKILDAIEKDDSNSKPLRVWWVGIGQASSMPFHAAGIHGNGSDRDNAYRVISSYTSSIGDLAHAQALLEKLPYDNTKEMIITAISMSKTPRSAKESIVLPDLDCLAEIESIKAIVQNGRPIVQVLEHPPVKEVFVWLDYCSIFHLSCHGKADSHDPSNSHLILQKRGYDGQFVQDLLTVYDIAGRRVPNAYIAFLSACSTAQNKVRVLQDEALYLTSGFKVAGFPHVIGCLWPAGDTECAQITGLFYRKIFETERLAANNVAIALREAVMNVRAKDLNMPLLWAQFVHHGA